MVAQVKPQEQQFEGSLFNQEITWEYSPSAIVYALVGLRLVMGWALFQSGIAKVLDPTWSAAGFLQNVSEGNPFPGLWAAFAGNPTIDFLVAWGLTLTGLGLILGALVRWNAFWGAFIMLMFWLASLQGGLTQFLPLEDGWVVDQHIVYAVLLFGLGAFGAGRVLGLDAILEKTHLVRRNRWLKYLLG
jgi:thiosulfate dehydrogenase [quinone] large subunit